MASRLVVFNIDDLLKLMTHYSEGAIPLTAEVKDLQVSARLPRWVNLIVESNEWEGTPFEGDGYGGIQPFLFRYEGKRTLNLGHLQDKAEWSEPNAIETPKRQ